MGKFRNRICILAYAHSMSSARVYSKEAISLADSGYRFCLLARRSYDSSIVEHSKNKRLHVIKRGRGICVEFPLRPKSIWLRLLVEPWWMFRYFVVALRVKGSVYHCHEPQSLLLGLLLRTFCGGRVVYDCHEYQPESTAEFFPKSIRSFILWLARNAERFAARRVDAVVTVNEELQRRFEQDCSRVVLLPNYPLLDAWSIDPVNTSLWPGQKVLIYHGGITSERGALFYIDIMRVLVKQIPDVLLIMVGSVTPVGFDEKLKEMIELHDLNENVKVYPWMPQEKIKPLVCRADIGLFIPDPYIERYRRAEPTKFFEYAACGTPVVFSDVPVLRRLVEEADNGILVDPCDSAESADAVCRLLRNEEMLATMGERGRAAFMARLNWESIVPQLLELYRDLNLMR